jgi:hypothetical protein
MIDIHFTDGAIEYINQELNGDNGVVLTLSRKPKTSCFPIFTGNIIRLENREDFKYYLEKYTKVEENKQDHKFDMYIEKRLLFEEGNEYYSTIDVETFEDHGEIYGDLFEVGFLFNK